MTSKLTFSFIFFFFFLFIGYSQQPCYIFFDDFEASTLQSHWQGHFTGQTSQFYLTNTSAAVGNTSLESNSGFSTTIDGIYADFPSSQPTEISFWVKTSNVMSGGQALVCIGDSNIAMGASTHIIFVNYHNGGLRVIGDQTNSVEYILPAADTTWYFLEFKNMDWVNQQSDLYIDNQLVAPDFGFRFPMDSVSRVVLSTGYNSNNSTSSWDDIAIVGGFSSWSSNVDTICSGDSYAFPNGSSASNITQTTVDTSYLQSVSGCDSTVYTYLYVATTVDSIYADGDTLLALPENTTFSPSYSWFDCNTDSVVSTTNYPVYFPTIGGSYGVVVSNVGCVDTSNCITFSAASTFNGLYSGEFSLYPNPADDFVLIDLSNNYSNISLEIFDYSGRLVQHENYLNTQFLKVNLEINTGLYLFKVTADNNKQYFRVIKK